MMTISESQYSSNKRSSVHTVNDRVVHRDSYDDVKSSSSVNSALVTKRGFKPSDMFDPQKKEFLTNLSYKLFPVSWSEADSSDTEEAVTQSSESAYKVEEVSETSNLAIVEQLESTRLHSGAPIASEVGEDVTTLESQVTPAEGDIEKQEEDLASSLDLFSFNGQEFGTHYEAVVQPPEYYECFSNDGEFSGVRDEAIMQPPDSAPEDLENKPIIVGEKEIDLNKIFTPAPDAEEHIIKKDRKFEKTFASSAFYVPGVHPTVKEQMDLARAISKSLSDSSNHMSRGQSMYVNRKKRSVKWVHEGRGRNTSNTCSTPSPVANHDTAYRPPSSLRNQKTYPKSVLKHSPNNLPKIEPFPVSNPTINLQNLDMPVPLAPTKLNDVYASPKSPRLPLVCGPNFNVAPRGWGEMKDYYRPVPLDVGSKGYSDF